MRDESGVMAPQILFFFFIMLLVGGVAVDLMRFEARRVAVQQTMDRATLAAASLENTLIPQDVVNSYFATAGLEAELKGITVIETANGKTVRALATVRSDNYFMSMMDVPYLEADNRSQAEQRINDIEIMLVLDVSGSMAGAKLTNLKTAANEFITTVTENDPEGRVSIGIVPYNAQVNLGAPLRSKYTVTNAHGVANADCIELPSNVFSTLALSRTTPMPMMAVADTQGTTNKTNGWVSLTDTSYATPGNSAGRRWCNPSTNIDVTLPTKNKTSLTTAINALVADGNTSILLGMRWATALMDPGAKSMYNQLIGEGAMPGAMAGRPFEYDSSESMKVIVLMTDGQHVAHGRVADAYKTGTSPIYRSSGDGNLSIYHNRANTTLDYWVPHRSEWRATAWTSNTTAAVQQTWQQVWARVRVSWVAWQLYARALGTSSDTRNTVYNNTMGTLISQYQSVASMDALLAANCTAARAQNVLIYGIAFEAPAEGSAAISDCSSKPTSTYFFDANGLEIQTAFQLIAANLSQLRLTQ